MSISGVCASRHRVRPLLLAVETPVATTGTATTTVIKIIGSNTTVRAVKSITPDAGTKEVAVVVTALRVRRKKATVKNEKPAHRASPSEFRLRSFEGSSWTGQQKPLRAMPEVILCVFGGLLGPEIQVFQ